MAAKSSHEHEHEEKETPPDTNQRLDVLEEEVATISAMLDNAGIRPETHGPKEE